MSGQEYGKKLYQLVYICGMNQRYHSKLKRWWAIVDRGIRIIVGVLAIAAAIFAVPPLETPWASLWVATASAVAAFVLNIAPVGDWEKIHAELFRLWSDLRKDTEQASLKACDLNHNEPVPAYLVERIHELTGKEHSLDSNEPTPVRWLLRRCQWEENQYRFGPQFKTFQQVEAERARRLALYSRLAAAGAAGAADPGAEATARARGRE
jgi:hypothetical protein